MCETHRGAMKDHQAKTEDGSFEECGKGSPASPPCDGRWPEKLGHFCFGNKSLRGEETACWWLSWDFRLGGQDSLLISLFFTVSQLPACSVLCKSVILSVWDFRGKGACRGVCKEEAGGGW